MKRDPRLHGLTTDHHHALRLAFDVRTACASGRDSPVLAARVAAAYEAELGPHFDVEEEVLLPALAAAGEQALVDRTHAEHAALRALVAAAGRGETSGLAEFARLLHDHVRFEENELFPACEAGWVDPFGWRRR
jgi:hemerythrin-like domain-containing protein